MRRSLRYTGKRIGPVKLSKVIRDREIEQELQILVSKADWDQRAGRIKHLREARLRAIDVSKTSTSNSSTFKAVQSFNMKRRSREWVIMEHTTDEQLQHRHNAIVHQLITSIIQVVDCSLEEKKRAYKKLCEGDGDLSIRITSDIEIRRECDIHFGDRPNQKKRYELLLKLIVC